MRRTHTSGRSGAKQFFPVWSSSAKLKIPILLKRNRKTHGLSAGRPGRAQICDRPAAQNARRRRKSRPARHQRRTTPKEQSAHQLIQSWSEPTKTMLICVEQRHTIEAEAMRGEESQKSRKRQTAAAQTQREGHGGPKLTPLNRADQQGWKREEKAWTNPLHKLRDGRHAAARDQSRADVENVKSEGVMCKDRQTDQPRALTWTK
jgi:hypothetical protein